MNLRKYMMAATISVVTIAPTASVLAHDIAEAPLEERVRFIGDTEFAGFCKAVMQDDVTVLRRQASKIVGKVADSQRDVLRIVASAEGVTCNGKTLVEFSEEKQANNVHSYLTAKI